jgi:Cu/Ag efflux protein CusF
MKKLMMAITLFVVAFSFAAMTMAEAPKAKASKVSGEITAVDAAAKTVTVKGKDKDVTLMVTDMTKIMHGKEKLALADIQVGAKVTAIFVEDGDKMTAKSIHIAAAKKK